jgi:hypothetical protein
MRARHNAAVALLVLSVLILGFAAFLGFAGASDHSESEALGGLTMALSGIGFVVLGIALLRPSN